MSNPNVAVVVQQECAIAAIRLAKVPQSGPTNRGQPLEGLGTESKVVLCTKAPLLVDVNVDDVR